MNSLVASLWLAVTIYSFIMTAYAVKVDLCRSSCEVEFETIGCFRDMSSRALPRYIYNERDPSTKNFGGRKIDWLNWNVYHAEFACRCAEKAKELGYDLFGLQYYGECWAGKSSQDNFALYGKARRKNDCIGDDFQPCEKSRYCIGGKWSNMVYRIVDTSCPEAPFVKVECFNDEHRMENRPLPDYLFNDRDPSTQIFSGKKIDWVNWDLYIPKFACRCAKAAKAFNATFFGMQFYGECWSSKTGHLTYDINGLSKAGCIDQCYEPCKKHSKFCSGKNFANCVYKLRDGSCEVDITPVGCFNEDPSNPAMSEIFYNELSPRLPGYGGNLLNMTENYAVDFAEFLCKCARYAKENKWEYFGVRELGVCVRSTPTITDYYKYGQSLECSEGRNSAPCRSGSRLCTSLSDNSNYVYKVKIGINISSTLLSSTILS